jgi:hypothetical protein
MGLTRWLQLLPGRERSTIVQMRAPIQEERACAIQHAKRSRDECFAAGVALRRARAFHGNRRQLVAERVFAGAGHCRQFGDHHGGAAAIDLRAVWERIIAAFPA